MPRMLPIRTLLPEPRQRRRSIGRIRLGGYLLGVLLGIGIQAVALEPAASDDSGPAHNLQNALDLFAAGVAPDIRALAEQPENEGLYQHLIDRLRGAFPHALAAGIVDPRGLLSDDPANPLTPACLQGVAAYRRSGQPPPPVLHTADGGTHFEMLTGIGPHPRTSLVLVVRFAGTQLATQPTTEAVAPTTAAPTPARHADVFQAQLLGTAWQGWTSASLLVLTLLAAWYGHRRTTRQRQAAQEQIHRLEHNQRTQRIIEQARDAYLAAPDATSAFEILLSATIDHSASEQGWLLEIHDTDRYETLVTSQPKHASAADSSPADTLSDEQRQLCEQLLETLRTATDDSPAGQPATSPLDKTQAITLLRHGQDPVGILLLQGHTTATDAEAKSALQLLLKHCAQLLHCRQRERRRLAQHKATRAHAQRLYTVEQIFAATDMPLKGKIEQLLQMGCTALQTDMGVLATAKDGVYKVEHAYRAAGVFDVAEEYQLDDMYCEITLQSAEPVAFEHAAAGRWRQYAACTRLGLQTYLGAAIDVDGTPYGTLQFSSREPRTERFNAADKEFVQLLARWIGAEIHAERTRSVLENELALQRGILNSADYAIITSDPQGTIQGFNAAAERLLGYRAGELSGELRLLDLHEREEITARASALTQQLGRAVPAGFEALTTLADTGVADENQWTYIRKNGTRIPALGSMTAVRNHAGEITAYLSVVNDRHVRGSAHDLSNAREQLRRILDAAGQGIYGLDLQGRATFVNPAACKLLGYHAEELIGRPAHALIHHSYPDGSPYPAERCPMYAAFADGTTRRVVDEVLWRKDGSSIPVEYTSTPIYANGQLAGAVVTFDDISERIEIQSALQVSTERFELAVRGSSDGLWDWNILTNEVYYAPRFKELLGYEDHELENVFSTFESRLHADDHDRVFAAVERHLQNHEPYDIEYRLRTKSGGYRWFRARGQAIWDAQDQPIRMAGSIMDIETRKKVESLKAQFISTVSHELRTPLTSIKGSLGLLRGGAAGPMTQDQAQSLLEIAYNNSERLLLLINDLLDIDKLESGTMHLKFEPVDVHLILQQAAAEHTEFAAQFDVTVDLDCELRDVAVEGDTGRLKQVLGNLVTNAVKYSPPHGQVLIRATQLEHHVRISVCDRGPGIPKEFREHIFKKFAQADASDTRSRGGTGLGLAISKAIVDQHHGRLEFTSSGELGTVFYFDLPVHRTGSSKGQPTRLPIMPQARKVLVCEDDPDVAAAIEQMLGIEGYNTDIAYSAEQAKQLLEHNRYLAMTLDLILPGQSGVALMRELGTHQETADLPVIVVSIEAEQARAALSDSPGNIIDWLNKPIDFERLLLALRSLGQTRKRPRVLHVEDDHDLYEVVSLLLHGQADVVHAPDLTHAKSLLQEQYFDAVLLDLELPDGSGLELVTQLKQGTSGPPIVVFSAHETEPQFAHQVDAALVKSKASNEELIRTLLETLP